jgi:hypothetical protein
MGCWLRGRVRERLGISVRVAIALPSQRERSAHRLTTYNDVQADMPLNFVTGHSFVVAGVTSPRFLDPPPLSVLCNDPGILNALCSH